MLLSPYISPYLSSPPTLSIGLFSVWFSTATLKINSSVPSLQIPYICVSIWYLYFSFWLTSLCIMSSSCVHLIKRFKCIPFNGWVVFHCIYIYHSFFIHSSVDGHLGCFLVLATVNSAAINIGVHVSFSVLIPQGTSLGVVLLGHMVVLFLAF